MLLHCKINAITNVLDKLDKICYDNSGDKNVKIRRYLLCNK